MNSHGAQLNSPPLVGADYVFIALLIINLITVCYLGRDIFIQGDKLEQARKNGEVVMVWANQIDEKIESGESIDPKACTPASEAARKLLRFINRENSDGYARLFERAVIAVIILNLIALFFETIPIIYQTREVYFHVFDIVSVGFFTLEYLLRLYVAPEDPEFKGRFSRLRFIRSPFAIIDLLAILPFYLAAFFNIDLRALRALRLLRLFKLLRAFYPALLEFLAINRHKTLRQKIYAICNETPDSGKLHEIFDFFIVSWVLISVTAVILESVDSINYYLHVEFIILDTIAVAIFSTELIMRLYSCVENPAYQHWLSGRLKFARQPSSIIDILAIAPFFLESLLDHLFDLRFLRVFRLLRLMKLGRYSDATKSLFLVIQREWPVMKAAIFIMLMLVMLAACLGYLFEHEAQPDKFENIPQSIYWAVITLASVGYGDISPVTPAGRAITIVLALLGIGIFAIPAAILSSAFSDQLRIERETMKQELYEMLGDGKISPEERSIIDAEAKRLHLSKAEVDRLLEKARVELGLTPHTEHHDSHGSHGSHSHHDSHRHHLDLNYLSKHPEAAGEQFKILVAQL
ncbi:MAG: ion transporter, partial [Burkholderiaceae bacterium]|nr:ion transporter [Burkholderiaceae bacterium]